jgi:hypothetical protein
MVKHFSPVDGIPRFNNIQKPATTLHNTVSGPQSTRVYTMTEDLFLFSPSTNTEIPSELFPSDV